MNNDQETHRPVSDEADAGKVDLARLSAHEYVSDDREACLAIFDGNLGTYFAEHERDEFSEWLDKPDRESYLVWRIGKDVVACGGIYHDPEQNCVGLAWGMVRRDLHRQGIGRQLTERRVQQMSELYPNFEQRLGTSQHTFEFYQRMGFEVTSITPDGFGKGLDRYDMVRGGSGTVDEPQSP